MDTRTNDLGTLSLIGLDETGQHTNLRFFEAVL